MTAVVDIPESTLSAARGLASRRGLSVEEYLALAITDRVSAEDETEAFFRERMDGAPRGAWRAALARIPNRPAEPGDERDQ